MLDDKRLREIKGRVEAASPGPWSAWIEGRDHWGGDNIISVGEGSARRPDMELIGATVADYDFIAHARQDVPELLEEVARLRGQSSEARPAVVLDSTSNQAVVKLASRRYPGVLLQGDSLKILHDEISGAAMALGNQDYLDAAETLGEVTARLADLLAHYESTLQGAGIELPYPKAP